MLIMLAFSSPIWAVGQCGFIKVWIGNATKNICHLVSIQLKHGFLLHQPPETVVPGYYKLFYMAQDDGYGPEIILQYHCDQEIITITTQQNFCLFEGANITGIINQPLPKNLNITYLKEIGSFGEDKPGTIKWLFSEK